MVYFLSESLVMSDVTVKSLWVPWVKEVVIPLTFGGVSGVCLPEHLVLIGLVGLLVGFRQSWPPPMLMELHCPLWVKFPSLNSHRQMTWVRPKMNFLLNNWAQSSSLSELLHMLVVPVENWLKSALGTIWGRDQLTWGRTWWLREDAGRARRVCVCVRACTWSGWWMFVPGGFPHGRPLGCAHVTSSFKCSWKWDGCFCKTTHRTAWTCVVDTEHVFF